MGENGEIIARVGLLDRGTLQAAASRSHRPAGRPTDAAEGRRSDRACAATTTASAPGWRRSPKEDRPKRTNRPTYPTALPPAPPALGRLGRFGRFPYPEGTGQGPLRLP